MDKNIEVSDKDDSQRQKEVQLMTDGFCENYDQSNAKNVQTNDEQSNDDQANETDDHSKENIEVNGYKYDQVKMEKLFESIAIFLFFPNYKYRKKRRPGKLDL